ncbi:phosphotransferase [Micromonosporaceae bacterium DT55]|uniref:phosphotransferase n=1 Tax=Melissospora conviva TaxID=3388432 RepID=UPI003C1F5E04
MRPGEIVVAVEQVRALIEEQFPEWSDLPVVALPLSGTDNALFRLGDRLTVRLPRAPWAVDQVATDASWLPRLAPHLPVPVPAPVAVGRPGGGAAPGLDPLRRPCAGRLPGGARVRRGDLGTRMGLGAVGLALLAGGPVGLDQPR